MKTFAIIAWTANGEKRYEADTIAEIEAIIGFPDSGIEWAIEEYGRCDFRDYTIWKPSEEAGIEYPTAEAP